MLNVILLGSIFPNPLRPTHGTFCGLTAVHLSKVAHVRVIAPVPVCPGLGLFSEGERLRMKVPSETHFGTVHVQHPRFYRLPLVARSQHHFMYYHSVRRCVTDTAASFNPDVILATFAYPDGAAAVRLGAELGIPVVVKCIGSDVHQLLKTSRKGHVLETLNAATRIVTVSRSLKGLVMDAGIEESKIDVVYNGVDLEAFTPRFKHLARMELNLPRAHRYAVCVANLLPIKRHVDLLQAFADVQKALPDARLALVGDGPERKRLMAQVEALGLSDKVLFAGARPHGEISTWINAADVVCLASQNEGIPNALCEAIACGRPVVATSVGGVPELMREEDGVLVQPCDPKGLSRALIACLESPRVAERFVSRPELNSWQESSQALLNALQKAVSSGRFVAA